MSSKIVCTECLIKQEEIYRLREENQRLKAQLRRQERKITEGYFGSSTPSSKKPVKKNSAKANTEKNRGGAKPGHKGNGRRSHSAEQADRVEEVKVDCCCPECGNNDLDFLGWRDRSVIEYTIKKENIVYQLERKRCQKCDRVIQAKAPGVFAKNLYSNNLLAHVATEHYLNGIRFGHLERQTGVNAGSLIRAMHQLSGLFKEVPERLVAEYRQAPVKHADETGWRNNGQNGYAWIFATTNSCIFRLRKSRSGKVAQEVFGQKELAGVLVVDRYAGYNKTPCKIQYCYAHLLRHVQDLRKEFPDNKEVNRFVQAFAPLLAEAMNLKSLPIKDKEFYKRAARTKEDIIKIVNSQANHFGVQNIQNIFRENQHRLYHWANNRDIPADNNFAERELRPLVIARKVSFGSHSDAGAKTREILMTILRTLKLRTHGDVKTAFIKALNIIAENPKTDVYEALFL
ncbi:IS66 family transposase [candidate division KSB1 bacterium]|nr:IS66 family transposase [candidate division KSB1 bacterium]